MKRKLRFSTVISLVLVIVLSLSCLVLDYQNYQLKKEINQIKTDTTTLSNEIEQSSKDNKSLTDALNSQKKENDDLKKKVQNVTLPSSQSAAKPSNQQTEQSQVESTTQPFQGVTGQQTSTSSQSSSQQSDSEDSIKTVYLTFDDGPSNLTSQLLDTLKENDVKATFFVVGKNNDTVTGRGLMKREVDEGHTVGIHSYSHKYDYIYSSQNNFEDDFNKIKALIIKATGIEPKFIRFPGGTNNTISIKCHGGSPIMPSLVTYANDQNLSIVDWNAGGMDAKSPVPNKDEIINGVVEQVSKKNNAIVLLHDGYGHQSSIEAVPEIIKQLKAKGYIFKALTESSQAITTKPATKR